MGRREIPQMSPLMPPNSSMAKASGNADCPRHQRMGISVSPAAEAMDIDMAMDSAMRTRMIRRRTAEMNLRVTGA